MGRPTKGKVLSGQRKGFVRPKERFCPAKGKVLSDQRGGYVRLYFLFVFAQRKS